MGRHRKGNFVKVPLNDEDARALKELVRLEQNDRRDPEIGSATLLRELGMPRVLERLAEHRAKREPQPAGAQ